MATFNQSAIRIFSTCPISRAVEPTDYLRQLVDVARWSDERGCEGSLIYTGNSLVIDPWLVAQTVLQNTERLCPLVAVQPVLMHPYSVAKMVASFSYLYGRRIYLNMVAGGFVRDLLALGDKTEHDRRYDRLVEYSTIVKTLLAGHGPVTFSGEYYRVENLSLSPAVPPELFPGIMVSGSSSAGLAAARVLDATAVQYPRTTTEYEAAELEATDPGIRIGVIARDDADTAWDVAWKRFPESRRGQLLHQFAMKVSDSVWHRQLSQLASEANVDRPAYWLHPFQNYKTFCPFLVGSYDSVAAEISKYIRVGFRTFILDIPSSRDDLEHTSIAFERAMMTVRYDLPAPGPP
jgi:alkanesulfonate monooxygenase